MDWHIFMPTVQSSSAAQNNGIASRFVTFLSYKTSIDHVASQNTIPLKLVSSRTFLIATFRDYNRTVFPKDTKSRGVRCSSVKWAAKSSVTWFGSPPGKEAQTGQTCNMWTCICIIHEISIPFFSLLLSHIDVESCNQAEVTTTVLPLIRNHPFSQIKVVA